MKNALYLILIVFGLSSCNSSRVVISDTEVPEEVFFLDDQVKPFSGTCIIYFNNTKVVKEEMKYKAGILNGPCTSYYSDGQVKRKGSFLNGQMHGKWESWYKNGMRRYVANYENDTLNGEYQEWYSTGVMKEKGLYAQNLRSGSWMMYDEAGMVIK